MQLSKFLKNRNGSALLISLMIMGILLTLALGVSELLLGILRDNRLLIERTAAWYAAESGLEMGLLEAAKKPPGFEKNSGRISADPTAEYEYTIRGASHKIPYESDSYATLVLSESITIPLFRGENPENRARKFVVDYFLAPELKKSSRFINEDIDIIRWKIFGIAKDGINKGKMEVMNEFLPMETGRTTEESPSCFGTLSPQCWTTGTFYQYQLSDDGITPESYVIREYPISEFLGHHTQNFLVLTNTVNVDLVASADFTLSLEDKKKIANIRYRIRDLTDGAEEEKRLTLPQIHISADGYAGQTKQSLDISVKREVFLPVFNYSLYRTK